MYPAVCCWLIEICDLFWRDSTGQGQGKGLSQLQASPLSWLVFDAVNISIPSEIFENPLFPFEEQLPMADWRGMMSKSSGFGGGSMRNNEDFEEEDVWGVGNNESENSSPKMMRKSNKDSSSASSSAWRLPTAPRIIPRAAAANTPTSHEPKVVQKSAPQNIPDWSKIYGKSAKIGSWVHDDDDGYGVNGGHVAYEDGGHHHDHGVSDDDDDANNDGDGDDDDGMVPPHEWVARKLARSQISSFSVCEGIGRTLKGRDLSKVRNAILTKTGFLE